VSPRAAEKPPRSAQGTEPASPPVVNRRKFREHLCTARRGDGEPCRGGATRRSGYRFCPRDEIKAGLVSADEQALWWQKGGERSRHYPVVPLVRRLRLGTGPKVTLVTTPRGARATR
jgi:hypothetical protein